MSTNEALIRSGKSVESLLQHWVDDGAGVKAYLKLDPNEDVYYDMNVALQYANDNNLALVSYSGSDRDVTVILDSSFAGKKPAAVLFVDSSDANLTIATAKFNAPAAVHAKLNEL